MNDKQLTILIDGREALPVRAIPHVTKWIRFSPDSVSKYFARDERALHIARGRLLIDAYHLSGNAPVQVMPSEWDAVIARLDGFEAETWKQHGRDDGGEKIGYAAWCNGATAKLPEGAFVWLDEFEKVFQADVKCTGSYKKPGDDKLTLAPMLDAITRAMVMAGFETLPAAPAAKGKAAQGTNPSGGEHNNNDGDWRIKAKHIAQRLGEEQLINTGARQVSGRSICEAVSIELAKDATTHGIQGPRSADNVRNVGLRRWKFCPPKIEK